jgi:hypothetical protein
MHDDIIVTRDWGSEIGGFADADLALKVSGEILSQPLWEKEGRLELPHLDTSFLLCRKSALRESGVSWSGYYLPMKFHIGNLANFEKFIDYHEKGNILSDGRVHPRPSKDKEHSVLSVDIGGMAIYELARKGYFIAPMNEQNSFHFKARSWSGRGAEDHTHILVSELESELERYPEFNSLYLRYK